MDLRYFAKMIAWLAALGAVILFGSRFAGNVARRVPA
jgi:hypothetical protein